MNPNCYQFQDLAMTPEGFNFPCLPPPFHNMPPGPHPPQYFPPSRNCYNQQQQQHRGKRPFPRNNNSNKNTKKMKSENFIDFCDTCDRGFKTEEKKMEHYQQHKKCPEASCSFEAHFKIVDIHYRNLHENGLKIQLDTPEDIIKWRAERRKNFPTHAKVVEKIAEVKEKCQSGAVLEPQHFGKFKRGRGGHRGRRGRGNNFRGSHFKDRDAKRDVQNTPQSIVTSDEKMYCKSSNPMDLLVESTMEKEDGEIDSETEPTPVAQTTGRNISALGMLMSNYESDELSQSDNDQDASEKHDSNNSTNFSNPTSSLKTSNPPESNNKGGCTENVVRGKASNHSNTPHRGRNQKRHNNRRNQARQHQPPLSRPSLLRKLLEPEIRRERNDILQCVKYIVEMNFFQSKPTP